MRNILIIIAISFPALTGFAQQTTTKLPYKNRSLTPEQRAADLVKRMTVDEKIAQMYSNSLSKDQLDSLGNGKSTFLKKSFPVGIGQISMFCRPGNWFANQSNNNFDNQLKSNLIKVYNQLQRYCIENTRLGIPAICHDEALHGVATLHATCFPTPIALAGTFNPSLAEQLYSLAAEEARSRGVQQVLSPVNLDLAREPRWGRTEETFGEDPYLVGEMGISATKGLQGADANSLSDGIRNFAGSQANVTYSEGCNITTSSGYDFGETVFEKSEESRKHISEAVKVAQQADVVILAVGADEQLSRVVEPGEFEVMVGSSSRDEDLKRVILNVE
jgi:hypothetical protein